MIADDLKHLKGQLPSKWLFWKHRRYILALMTFFGFFNAYALRGNLSIAIVAMTSDRNEKLENGTVINIGPEFKWSNEIQGYILSSFFYGYITTQLLGGYFAKKYGGKIIFGTGIAVTAAVTLITPWLANNVYLLICARVVEGIFEGVTYPSVSGLWSQWVPPLERSGLLMFASAGSYFGTVIALPLSALLAEAFGWRSIFLFFGAVGLFWYACWLYIVTCSPDQDSKISGEELKYIQISLGTNTKEEFEEVPVPWRSIVSSKAILAICTSNVCENWGFYTFLTQLPKYLKDIYSFDLGTSGFLSGLPYLAMCIFVPVAGQLADFVLTNGYLTIQQCRKTWTFVGFAAQFVFLLAVAFASSEIVTVICLTFAVGIGGFALGGYFVNPLDIAPQYASIIVGFSNTFGTLPGIISPILSGYIISDDPTVEQWQTVFFIAAGLYIIGAIVFVICASGEVQSWAQKRVQTSNISGSSA